MDDDEFRRRMEALKQRAIAPSREADPAQPLRRPDLRPKRVTVDAEFLLEIVARAEAWERMTPTLRRHD